MVGASARDGMLWGGEYLSKGKSMSNGLIYIEGDERIEADGYLTIGFSANLDKELRDASSEDVAAELLRQLMDGDLLETGPVTSYKITGP